MNDCQNKEPLAEIKVGDSRITLLGTAHVSKASADQVRELLNSGDYDAVAVELCPSRYSAIMDLIPWRVWICLRCSRRVRRAWSLPISRWELTSSG